jgi:penicillin-binding protein 1A
MAGLDGFSPVVGGSVPARIWHDFMVPAMAGRRVVPLRGVTASQVALPPPQVTRGTTAPPPASSGRPPVAGPPPLRRSPSVHGR